MEENYEQMLMPKRRRQSSRGDLAALQESESDRARVLYSAAFRRLQRKTQVFPLEENAAVRSRLTHSLEVAHVGRYIATTVIEKLKSRNLLQKYQLSQENCLTLPNLVDTACLAHDIGNPPFGHFGEAAISAWAESQTVKLKPGSAVLRDFELFDGNPHGLRILSSLAGVDEFGMNLTAAQIASTVKYPCVSSQVSGDRPELKKAGVFRSEAGVWSWVRESLGLSEKCRFPVALMMEAADDISYCLSDIEDGIEKGCVSHQSFYDEVRRELTETNGSDALLDDILKRAKNNSAHVDETVFARSALVRALVGQASEAYVDKHASIFSGETSELLAKESPEYKLLKAIRKTVEKTLYGGRKKVELELAGCAAISGILKKYEPLIWLDRDEFLSLAGTRVRPSLVEGQRLFSLLPPKYVRAFHRSLDDSSGSNELYAKVQLVVDFVAGMTDVFALQTYQVITGIRSG